MITISSAQRSSSLVPAINLDATYSQLGLAPKLD